MTHETCVEFFFHWLSRKVAFFPNPRRRWGKSIGLRRCETPKTERGERNWEEVMMMQVWKKTMGFW